MKDPVKVLEGLISRGVFTDIKPSTEKPGAMLNTLTPEERKTLTSLRGEMIQRVEPYIMTPFTDRRRGK